MSNEKYPWEKIIKNIKIIIKQEIKEGTESLPLINELYETLKKDSQITKTRFPNNPKIFYRKMHTILGMPKSSKDHEPYLYKLVGKYDRVALNALANNLTISSAATQTNSNILFIKLRKPNSKITNSKTQKQANAKTNKEPSERLKDLYHLSQKLKNKFTQEIVFTTFDTNTLVVICKDENSKTTISNYLENNDKNNKVIPLTEREED